MIGGNVIDVAITKYDREVEVDREYEQGRRGRKAFVKKYGKELKEAGVDKVDEALKKEKFMAKIKALLEKNAKEKGIPVPKKVQTDVKAVQKAVEKVDTDVKKALETQKKNEKVLEDIGKQKQAERDKAKAFMKGRGIRIGVRGHGPRKPDTGRGRV